LACEGHFRDDVETYGIIESHDKRSCVFSCFAYCAVQDVRPIQLSLTLFNQSRHTISFGSCGTYIHEYEDFATGLV
jgi:hypothetical protein